MKAGKSINALILMASVLAAGAFSAVPRPTRPAPPRPLGQPRPAPPAAPAAVTAPAAPNAAERKRRQRAGWTALGVLLGALVLVGHLLFLGQRVPCNCDVTQPVVPLLQPAANAQPAPAFSATPSASPTAVPSLTVTTPPATPTRPRQLPGLFPPPSATPTSTDTPHQPNQDSRIIPL
jgi:hypothetical protein